MYLDMKICTNILYDMYADWDFQDRPHFCTTFVMDFNVFQAMTPDRSECSASVIFFSDSNIVRLSFLQEVRYRIFSHIKTLRMLSIPAVIRASANSWIRHLGSSALSCGCLALVLQLYHSHPPQISNITSSLLGPIPFPLSTITKILCLCKFQYHALPPSNKHFDIMSAFLKNSLTTIEQATIRILYAIGHPSSATLLALSIPSVAGACYLYYRELSNCDPDEFSCFMAHTSIWKVVDIEYFFLKYLWHIAYWCVAPYWGRLMPPFLDDPRIPVLW